MRSIHRPRCPLLTAPIIMLALLLSACQSSIAQTPAVMVADLDWLSGTWRGPAGKGQLEEQWSAPAPGSIAALVRTFDEEQTTMLELVSISDENDGLTLRIAQWSAQFEPRAEAPQVMRLVAAGERSISFEAVSAGGLQKLAYRVADPQTLTVSVTTSEGASFELPLIRVNPSR